MDCRTLTGGLFDLTDYRFGTPQQAGLLTVIPITGRQSWNVFVPPLESRRVGGRPATSSFVLQNDSESDCLLAPLHFGQPLNRNRSHILSRVALVTPAGPLDLAGEIAFPPQSSRRTRFDLTRNFILPLALRGPAWRVRHSSDTSRLTLELSDLQSQLSRHGLGTLSAAVQARNVALNTFSSRIELLTGQTGALFFVEDRPVGLEIAPSPAYFAAIWQPLLVGCYGLTALLRQQELPYAAPSPEPYSVSRLSELRTEMFRVRHQHQEKLEAAVTGFPEEAFTVEENQHWQNFRVRSLTGKAFAGQIIEEVTAAEEEVGGMKAMPRMLGNLFRKCSVPTSDTTRRRVLYVSFFALSVY